MKYERAKSLYHPNPKGIVLFIHGILEGPSQFDDLAGTANSLGYETRSLLLPGHGTTPHRFAKSNMQQWITTVKNTIRSYQCRYDRIYLVGHSMGALLAIHQALENPTVITGILSIALPLYIRPKPIMFRNCLRVLFDKIPKNDVVANAAKSAYSLENQLFYPYVTWSLNYLDLLALAKTIRENLPFMDVPMITVQSRLDEYISDKTVLYLDDLYDEPDLYILPQSTHFYYPERDRRILRSILEGMIS